MKLKTRLLFSGFTFLCFAMLIAGIQERSMRAQEQAMGLNFVPDEPALKYEFLPGPPVNSRGFNERELPLEKPAGIQRVAVIGDSVTHGASVSQPQIYSRVAEDSAHAAGFTRIQTLNFAVYGYDIESIRGLVHARVGKFNPDLVVYGFYINDPIPTEVVDTDHGRPNRHPVWVGTGPRNFSVLHPTVDIWLHNRSAFFRSLEGAAGLRHLAGRGIPEELAWDWFEEELDVMILDLQKMKIPMAAMLIPPHVLVQPDLDVCDERAERQRYCARNLEVIHRAQTIFSARGIPIIDGVAAYRAGGVADLFAHPGDLDHPNAEGQRRLGVAFGAALPGLLP